MDLWTVYTCVYQPIHFCSYQNQPATLGGYAYLGIDALPVVN